MSSKRARDSSLRTKRTPPRPLKRARVLPLCTIFTVDDLPDELFVLIGRCSSDPENISPLHLVSKRFARIFNKNYHLHPVQQAMRDLKTSMQSWNPRTPFIPLRDAFRDSLGGRPVPMALQRLYAKECRDPHYLRPALQRCKDLWGTAVKGPNKFWQWCDSNGEMEKPPLPSLPLNPWVSSIAEAVACIPNDTEWLMVLGRLLHVWYFSSPPLDVLCSIQLRLTMEDFVPLDVRTFLEHVFTTLVCNHFFGLLPRIKNAPGVCILLPVFETNCVGVTRGERREVISFCPIYGDHHPVVQFYLGVREGTVPFRYRQRKNIWNEAMQMEQREIEANARLEQLKPGHTLSDLLRCFAVDSARGHLDELAETLLPLVEAFGVLPREIQ
jgi:hypothetical protein